MSQRPQRIWLNAIFRNEMANLPRMLASVKDHVTGAVILDTGSTDGTQGYIRKVFREAKVPCHMFNGGFADFEQARNDALALARRYSREWDYLLLMDADMELVVNQHLPHLDAECYSLTQASNGLEYMNARLVSAKSQAKYHGVTHEYFDAPSVPLTGSWWFRDHQSGSNRGNKCARDIALLEAYIADGHPDDPRSLFYLAQSYRDSGNYQKALELYERRVKVGGWDEEVWYAQLQIARCHQAMGHEAEFIRNSLVAYNLRPSRAETLYGLARHYRERDNMQQVGWLFADAGSRIPKTGDFLFVEADAYKWGFTEEKSILGAYNDKTRLMGFDACDKLALMKDAPHASREGAKTNLYWYLPKLKDVAPSATFKRIPDVNPDTRYVNTNPSIAVVDRKLVGIVRTVSYRIRSDGTYDYNGFDAIRTTNWFVNFDAQWNVEKVVELQRPTGLPEPVFTGVLDVEDLRLYPSYVPSYELLATGCMLEQNQEAWREQFVMKINPHTGEMTDCHKINPTFVEKRHEKNWMPLLARYGKPRWMYTVGTVMTLDGALEHRTEPDIDVGAFSGGGQVLPWEGGYVAIIHEARPDPTNGKRYYWHRFVWFDDTFALRKVSRPFVFFDKQIEFAAGLALTFTRDRFIISFGVLDREAWLCSVSTEEVRGMIWHA